MADRNIVPYANGEGNIGTVAKRWLNVYAGLLDGLSVLTLGDNIIDCTYDYFIDFTAGPEEDGWGMKYDISTETMKARPMKVGNVLASLSDVDVNYWGGLEAGESLRYSSGTWYPYDLEYGYLKDSVVNKTLASIPTGTTWSQSLGAITTLKYVQIHLICNDSTGIPSWYVTNGCQVNVEHSKVTGVVVYQRGTNVYVKFNSTVTYAGYTLVPGNWSVRMDLHGD